MIGKDSALRRLPVSLDRRQVFFLDGVRVAIELSAAAHERLTQTLAKLADHAYEEKEREVAIVSALQDAWSIVDAVYRLRALLRRMPHLKQKASALQAFYRASREVDALHTRTRDFDAEVGKLLMLELPLWGMLQWLVLVDPSAVLVRSCTIAAGTLFQATPPIQNPLGRRFRSSVDQVVLWAGGLAVHVSDLMIAVGTISKTLERSLERQFATLPKHAADMLVVAEIQIVPDTR